MSVTYSLQFQMLTPSNINYIGRVRGVTQAAYTQVLGDIGELAISIDALELTADPQTLRDYKIVAILTMRKDGKFIQSVIDGVFIVKRIEKRIMDNGAAFIDLNAVDYQVYLRNRAIAYRGDTSQTTKSATTDDAMKALVRENLGSSSTTDYDGNAVTVREVAGLVVDADTSAGSTIKFTGIEWSNLLDTLKAIQSESATAGNETFFRCYAQSQYLPQFTTKIGLWGSDKTGKMRFSPSRRNLKNASVIYDYTDAKTAVYVAENGNAENRRINDYTSSLAIAGDATRAEAWASLGAADPESADTDSQFQAVAYSELSAKRPVQKFAGSIISTDQTPYRISAGGENWQLGDKITVQLSNTDTPLTPIIRAIQVTLENSGEVNIEARVETIEAI